MNQSNDNKDLLDAWWVFRLECCPLCRVGMRISSVSRHLQGDFCKTLLSLPPIERSEVFHYFSSLKSRFGGKPPIPHLQSQNEKVASAICALEGYRYVPHLEWKCEIQDGSTTWMTNSLLSLTRVGNRWIKRGQRQRKKGFLRDQSEDPSENESPNEEEEENQEVDPLSLLEQQEWNVEELLERKTF